jgi:putative transposon-encoded protein
LEGKLVGHGTDAEAVLKKVVEEFGDSAKLVALRYVC